MEDYLLKLRSAEPIDTVQCRFCGFKNKTYGVFVCSKFGKCTTRPYMQGQSEAICVKCDLFDDCRKPITFAWPYIDLGTDELRYSIRSIAKFSRVPYSPLVCGDIPNWYIGPAIRKKKTATGDYGVWIDTVEKLRAICEHPETSDDFVYMHDDYYWLKPFALPEISRIRYNGAYTFTKMPITNKRWISMQWTTAEFVKERGYTVDANWSSHTPFFLNKHKTLEVLDEMSKFGHPYLFEVAYFSKFSSFSEGHFTLDDSARLIELHDVEAIEKQCSGKVVMNHISAGFTDSMKTFLRKLMPDKSEFESGFGARILPPRTSTLSANITPAELLHLEPLCSQSTRSLEIGCGRIESLFPVKSNHVCVDVVQDLVKNSDRSRQGHFKNGVIVGVPTGEFDLLVVHSDVPGMDLRRSLKWLVDLITPSGTLAIFPDRKTIPDSEMVARLAIEQMQLVANTNTMLLFSKKKENAQVVACQKFDGTAIVPCVNYTDLLEITLPSVASTFSRTVVVTSIKDTRTIQLASKRLGIENVICTEKWFDHGAVFNRGSGLNEALKHIAKGWIALIDCDTLLPSNAACRLNQTTLQTEVLYSPRLKLNGVRLKASSYSEVDWKFLPSLKDTSCLLTSGYFVLFHASNSVFEGSPSYPSSHLVFGEDLKFKDKFLNKQLLSMLVLDVNPNPLGVGWKKIRQEFIAQGKGLIHDGD